MQHRPLPHQPQRSAAALATDERNVPFVPAIRPAGRAGQKPSVANGTGRARRAEHPRRETTRPALPPVVRLAAIYRTFGLREDPFPLQAASTAILPALAGQAGMLAAWLVSPAEAGRLAIVSGPARSGRSTLLDAACNEAARTTGTTVRRADLAALDGPVTDGRFLRAIVVAFGAEPAGRNGLDLIRHIREIVAACVAGGERPVLAIDGAELAGSRLDLLRALLTDADDAAPGHGLRIAITGTPEFRDRILRRQALRERLTLDLRIEPVTEAALEAFIRDRIAAVALDEPVRADAEAFSPEAVAIIGAWSGGVIGPAIELAGECLLEAIARGTRPVDRDIAHDVAREFTDRAREAARHQAASPFIVPAVQARLALPFAGEPGTDGTVGAAESSRTTTARDDRREERR
ncbi:MAG: AAA family ATPase [Thermomicrobiales bacterium]